MGVTFLIFCNHQNLPIYYAHDWGSMKNNSGSMIKFNDQVNDQVNDEVDVKRFKVNEKRFKSLTWGQQSGQRSSQREWFCRWIVDLDSGKRRIVYLNPESRSTIQVDETIVYLVKYCLAPCCKWLHNLFKQKINFFTTNSTSGHLGWAFYTD